MFFVTSIAPSKTNLVNITDGLTSYLQVLDVVVNKPFKDYLTLQSELHMHQNLDRYVKGKFSASHRRVLITKWCAEAWQDSVKRGFKKLGLTIALNGTEDDQVSIPKLPDYRSQLTKRMVRSII